MNTRKPLSRAERAELTILTALLSRHLLSKPLSEFVVPFAAQGSILESFAYLSALGSRYYDELSDPEASALSWHSYRVAMCARAASFSPEFADMARRVKELLDRR